MSRLIDCKTGWRKVAFSEKLVQECAMNGIECLENDCTWNDDACKDYDYSVVQKWAKKHGIYLQSVHLALGDELDLSNSLTKDRATGVIKKQIFNAAAADVKYAVLHASAEPIGDDERDERFKIAAECIAELCEYSGKNGVVLCVENLPRSCLCNDIGQLRQALNIDERLRVCFDVNHLLKCTHKEFVEAFGDKIVTTHISDYDFLDDRHWVPGDGKIDWLQLAQLLESVDYSGAFLFECDVDRRKPPLLPLEISAYRKIHENIANGKPPLFELV